MRLIDFFDLQAGENRRIVRIIPGARETCFSEIMENGVCKIRLKAVAEKGKANQELLRFLSGELSIALKDIHILSGATSQNKTLNIYKH